MNFSNPYTYTVLMLIVDLAALFFIIKSIVSKTKGKPKKRLKLILTSVTALIVCDAVFVGVTVLNSFQYDRSGKRYAYNESIAYFMQDGTEYTYEKDADGNYCFVTDNGRESKSADRMYVDADGYLYFDKFKQLKKSENQADVYTDADGNSYYRADSVEWKSNGSMKLKKR